MPTLHQQIAEKFVVKLAGSKEVSAFFAIGQHGAEKLDLTNSSAFKADAGDIK